MEKKKYTYNLTFEEVLEEIWYKDCWYQGNNFGDGTIIYANVDRELCMNTFDGAMGGHTHHLILTERIYEQMYRRVYTQPDAERRV